MDSLILEFFQDELIKLASSAKKRKRHTYYMANRNAILNRQRMYRQKNAAKIRRRQKIYRNKVKSGARKVRKRISTGNSYSYGSYR